MSLPAAPDGYRRFLMKSAFGAGRDFQVLDPVTEEQVYLVDGKLGPRPKAEVLDVAGTLLYSVRGQLLGIPKKMAITDASGAEVASLRAKAFSVVKDRMDLQMASGDPWHVEGSLVEKDYTATSGGSSRSRLNAVLVFQDTSEFVYFFNGEANKLLSEGFQICHFCRLLKKGCIEN